MRSAEIGFKFDCHAFMSFANDESLILLYPKFAKNAILYAMANFSNFLFCVLNFIRSATSYFGWGLEA